MLMNNEKEIYTCILAMVPNMWDADDIMQEVILVLWRKFSEFRPGTNFAAWAKAIARNIVLKHREQKIKSHVSLSDKVVELLQQDIEALSDQIDVRMQYMQDCVDKLPDQHRQLIYMRYQQNYTSKQIAQSVGRSIHAVYRILIRIEQALLRCVRRALAEEGLL